MKTNQIKLYKESEVISHGKIGWFYTEPKYPCGEVEWARWV